jgi:tripartite-type tricarboxylate transporter receptor subunit TctC
MKGVLKASLTNRRKKAMKSFKRRVGMFTGAVLALLACGAQAQSAAGFPNKPIRILVPFTASGTADTLARVLGQKITETWGQQVIVENRAGAGGTIGMEAARRLAGDGYNYVLVSNSQAVSHVLYSKISYDVTKDFVPINLIASSPMIVAVHPRVAAKNIAELMAQVKREPGKLSYGSCGVGTAHHLAMEMVKFQTQSFIVHIPYRGCGPAVVDALAGQADLVVGSSPAVLPHVRQGKLRALAVTNGRRTPSASEIPTIAESGVPALKGFDVDNWYGFMAPLGTPKDVLAKFDGEVQRLMGQADVLQRLSGAGIDPRLGGAAELISALDADIKQFRKVVDFAGIKAE